MTFQSLSRLPSTHPSFGTMQARQLTASRATQDDQFNPTGATESQGTLANLGLSKEEGARVSEFYWAHMNHVYAELIKRGKFAWQLLWTGQPDCPYLLRQTFLFILPPFRLTDIFDGAGTRPLTAASGRRARTS